MASALEAKLRRLADVHPDSVGFLADFLDDLLGDESRDGMHLTTDTMKQRSSMQVAWPQERPRAGWNNRVELQKTRTPAVPASLDLTLEEYYAAAALVGILSAHNQEPDMKWAASWAHEMGVTMAAESRKRRKGRRR